MLVCVASSLSQSTWGRENDLRFCLARLPDKPNGLLASSQEGFVIGYALVERLFRLNKQGDVEPELAESWEWSEDGYELKVTLKTGVVFQTNSYQVESTPLRAQDVVYSFTRLWDVSHPLHRISGGVYPTYESSGVEQFVESVEALSEREVVIRLKKRHPNFLVYLAMDFFGVYSQKYAETLQKSGVPLSVFDEQVISTALYQIERQTPQQIVLRKNEQYRDSAIRDASVQRIIFPKIEEATTRYWHTLEGSCDIMLDPQADQRKRAQQTDEVLLYSTEKTTVGYLGYHVEHPRLKSSQIRDLIDLALDEEAIAHALFDDPSLAGKNLFPGYLDDSRDQERLAPLSSSIQQEIHRKLVREGFDFQKPLQLGYMAAQRPYNPNPRLMATLIGKQLERVGIQVDLHAYEWGNYIDYLRSGQHELFLLGWSGDVASPDSYTKPLQCASEATGLNRARYCSLGFEGALQSALSSHTQAEQRQLYEFLRAIFEQERPWSIVVNVPNYAIVRKEIQGYEYLTVGRHKLEGVSRKAN